MAISLSLGVACAGENISSTHPELLSVEESPIDVESEPVEIDNDVSTTEENDILSSSDDVDNADESQNDEILSATEKPNFEQENDESAKTEDNEILSAGEGSFTELQNLINSYNEGSTIRLNKDYSYIEGDSKDGIVIGKDLIIDGQNHVIDGKAISKIFYVDSNSTIVLKNIKFINSIFAVDAFGIDLSVDNCTFDNNTQAIRAIYSYFQYTYPSNILVNNSYFTNSQMDNIFFSGVVYGENVSIYNSHFVNNNGSAVNANILKIHNSNFINNSGVEGSPVNCAMGQISNSNFFNNSANPGYNHGNFISYGGGAVSAIRDLNVTDSYFVNNCARNYGGAIYMRGGNSYLNVRNSYFINNFVNESGGAIFAPGYEEGSVNIVDSHFINNSAGHFGGAVFAYYKLKIKDSEFNNNHAHVGGAICTIVAEEIENSIFNDNTARLGKNIAVNSTSNLNLDEIYYFIHRTEDKFIANLSDGYTIFIDNFTGNDFGMYHYPNFRIDGSMHQNAIGGIYFLADKSKINDYFLDDMVYYYNLNLSERNFGISDSQQAVYDLYSWIKNQIFDENRWNDIKLTKVKELLNDSSINMPIPDHGFMKQINETTYAFVDFELLQSVRHWTFAYVKNGVGTYSYWLPAYKLTYMDISEISNLTVEKISLNPTVNVGEVSSFDIIVKNTGLIDLTGVFVSEIIPEGLTYISHSDSDVWIKTGDMFNYLKNLAVNETVKFTIDFNTTKVGNFTNVVIAGSNETGNKTANNTTEVINKTDVPENEIPENNTDIPEETPGNNTVVENDYPTGEDVDLRNDYAMGPVKNESTPADESTSENKTQADKSDTPQNGDENVKVDKNATGNPIFLALFVLLAALTTLRRRD